jgi:hypothetical protein
MLVLEISVRGRPWTKASQGIRDFAHAEVVPAFEAITTNKMHSIWGNKGVVRT